MTSLDNTCCWNLFVCRWDISVICPVIVKSKLAITVFTNLYFQALWPNWLNFFRSLKKVRSMTEKILGWKLTSCSCEGHTRTMSASVPVAWRPCLWRHNFGCAIEALRTHTAFAGQCISVFLSCRCRWRARTGITSLARHPSTRTNTSSGKWCGATDRPLSCS